MNEELTERQNRANAIKAQRRVDSATRKALELRDEIDKTAAWTEDNVDAPGAVANLMAAQGYVRDLIDALALEASPLVAKKAIG